MQELLRLDAIIEKLKLFPWSKFNVEWTVVFGGLVEKGVGRDVDILVNAELGSEEKLDLALAIADFLGVCWDCVDIVLFKEAPCPIILSSWKKGVVVYAKNIHVFREQMLVKISICEDYKISFRKLEIVPTAIRVAKEKWVKHYGGTS